MVVLILVCGSSGVGLLSVRQSRLQAAHEMAEARHRSQILEEVLGELRASIAQISTPDRVADLLAADDRYTPAIHQRATLVQLAEPIETPMGFDGSQQDQAPWLDDRFRDQHAWILSDGSRVILVDD
jgi:hypothetical protein